VPLLMMLGQTNLSSCVLPFTFNEPIVPSVEPSQIESQENGCLTNTHVSKQFGDRLALINIHSYPALKTPFEEKSPSIGKDDLQAVRTVIENQIGALRNGDINSAFSYASPTIQSQYGNATTFAEAVKSAYAPIFDSHSVVFEDPKEVMGLVSQPVLLLSSDGEMVMASYLMEKEDNGDWRITGCYLAPVK
jgi:Domain of unknown function (DUF4864)